MIRSAVTETRVFESWKDIQEALKRAIEPLTDEQMAGRLVPGLRSVGEIAEHIVFGRALHLTRVLGKAVAEVEPILTWDKPDDPPRTAAEVVHGLDLTWKLLAARLMRGTATDDLSDEDE